MDIANKLSGLQLARYSKLFYKLGNLVRWETLGILYYSLFYNRIQYGITMWATVIKTSQEILD